MSTTEASTIAGGTQSKNRPPADDLINEVFFDKKCARKEPDHKKFYTWCASAGPYIKTTCLDIGGSSAECQFKAEFINTRVPNSTVPTPNSSTTVADLPNITRAIVRILAETNATINGTTTTMMPTTGGGPDELPKIKEGDYTLHYIHKCDLGGPNHINYWEDTIPMNKSTFDDVTTNCYQELYGKPNNMPWWLIVLIVLVVLAAVGVAFTLFWRYWLRQRVYGSRRQDGLGRYTSAPFSSVSSTGASRASGIRASRSGSSRPSKVSSIRRASSSRLPSNSQASGSKLPSGSQPRSMSRTPSASRPSLSSSRSSAARRLSQRSTLSRP